jgi:hypothetical protein
MPLMTLRQILDFVRSEMGAATRKSQLTELDEHVRIEGAPSGPRYRRREEPAAEPIGDLDSPLREHSRVPRASDLDPSANDFAPGPHPGCGVLTGIR